MTVRRDQTFRSKRDLASDNRAGSMSMRGMVKPAPALWRRQSREGLVVSEEM